MGTFIEFWLLGSKPIILINRKGWFYLSSLEMYVNLMLLSYPFRSNLYSKIMKKIMATEVVLSFLKLRPAGSYLEQKHEILGIFKV